MALLSFLIPHRYTALCILVLVRLFIIAEASSSSSSNIRIAVPKLEPLPLHGTKPNKFVASAPLIVAAVCKDGVAIVATHTAPLSEPLLMDEANSNQDENENENNEATNDNDSTDDDSSSSRTTNLPRDIPLSFRGPFRIQSVDGLGTTCSCAGWRTDGEQLASAFRSLATLEADRFGAPIHAIEYGHFLAEEASTWMAHCAVSSSQRALSCVGLLATGGRQEGDDCGLWLVDATGAYRVRAHAVGLGAKTINERLRRIDFSSLTRNQGALRLLETIVEEQKEEEISSRDKDQATPWKLPDNALAEVAVVASCERKMKRIRIDDLLSSEEAETT